MSRYRITYKCGHEDTFVATGKQDLKDWLVEREKGDVCPACRKEQWAQEARKKDEECAKRADEMELPKLVGTEKQIAFGNKRRMEFIDWMEKYINRCREEKSRPFQFIETVRMHGFKIRGKSMDALVEAYNRMVSGITSASAWIDIGGASYPLGRAAEEMDRMYKERDEAEAMKSLEESTVFPEEQTHADPADIIVEGTTIKAKTEKDGDFIAIVKKLNYTWDGAAWKRSIKEKSGPVEDRAAELGNRLLAAGFAVRCSDPEILKMAASADYRPEQKNWVDCLDGVFAITWDRDGENSDALYKRAKSLPGAYYRSGAVRVKLHHCMEVLDFAECFGFKITEQGRKAADAYKQLMRDADRVEAAQRPTEEEVDRLQEKLKNAGMIVEDLIDEAE